MYVDAETVLSESAQANLELCNRNNSLLTIVIWIQYQS